MPARVAALVVAAGRGMRAGDGSPKQYRQIGGVPMIRTTLSRMIGHPGIDLVQPVIHAEDAALFQAAADGLATLPAVAGGATRQDSVLAGLEALAAHGPEIVLVHDAARPFASAALIARTIAKAVESGSAIPAVRIVDGVKAVDATGRIVANVDRDPLRTVQTPQGFRFAPLLEAHRKARADGRHDFVDDAGVFEWAGMPVHVVEGEPGNLKLTTAEDFSRVEAQARMQLTDIRTATGFDVHAFGDGDHVMLGGLRIAHTRAALGHSDADVVLHALTDAILGALADGDIGHHFPPTEQRWRGAASDQFLAFAVERVRARGGRISLLDVTVLCEAPRIGPHRDAMRENIARIAGIAVSRVAVKATTTERLGFTGRGEGIAALATATVRLSGDADE